MTDTFDTSARASRQEAIQTLVEAWTPQALAALIVDALAVAGGSQHWDGATADDMVAVLNTRDLPDLTGGNTPYWQHILDASRITRA